MSTAAINIEDFRRRRTHPRGMGDDTLTNSSGAPTDNFGAGTVSVPQLQSENQVDAFTNLTTPYPYFGTVPEAGTTPYGSNQSSIPGVDGDVPFTFYTPATTNIGGSGQAVRPGTTAGASMVTSTGSTTTSSSTTSGVLGTIETFLEAPLYAGSSLTWGWALLIAAVGWFVLSRD
jgi:hypothetical protein